MVIVEMDRQQCITLLEESRHGRLACAKDGQPYVVPFTYALDENYFYSFSLVGQKVEWMRQNPKVCVQVDQFSDGREWRSVVAFGSFEELPDRVGSKVQRERAWSLLSREADWWVPGGFKPAAHAPEPHLFYRIAIAEVSGRHSVPDTAKG